MRYALLILLLIIPIKINAVHEVIDSRCTTELKVSLKEEAKDVTYRLSKVTNNNVVTYSLILYNVSSNLEVYDSNDNLIKERLNNIKPGSSFIINIYASNKNYCEGYKAGSRIISVPNYNVYSTNPLCNGYEDYALCREDANINMTEEEFKKKMNEYISSLKPDDEKEEEVINENKFDISEFLSVYGIDIIGFVAIIGVIATASILENKRKNKGIL